VSLPFGTAIDVSNGRGITLTDGARGRLTISGQRDGVLSRVEIARVAGLVELRLAGGNFKACGARELAATSRAVRRLWANGEGKFRIKGRYASVTRGGWWLTTDLCESTVVQARKGSLLVKDLVTQKTVVVKAPKTYTARPRA
jgi:hypothetical protein